MTSAPVNRMEQYTLLRCSMTRTIICCIPQIYPYITNDRGPYRIGHCTRYTPPAGLEDATPPARLATTPTHVPCTEAGSLPFRACPPRGTTGLQPVVKRRGGPAVVRAIAPLTRIRAAGPLSACRCEGTCNTGRAGIGQVPFSALLVVTTGRHT